MGQAENFINIMLGWIRGVASGVASMFQSASGTGDSTGQALLSWFSGNWMWLLVLLILVGILVDWLVWMARWRPYWLWFKKRRVILDDDIDDQLTEEELRSRYRSNNRARDAQAPHFQSSARRRAYDAYPDEEMPYEEEETDEPLDYDRFVRLADDEDPDDAQDEERPDDARSPADAEDAQDSGHWNDPAYAQENDEAADDAQWDEQADAADAPAVHKDEFDAEWDDVPRKKKAGFKFLGFAKRQNAASEDPFEVPGDLDDLDDDFYSAVSAPRKPSNADDMRLYARPAAEEDAREEDEASEDISQNTLVAPTVRGQTTRPAAQTGDDFDRLYAEDEELSGSRKERRKYREAKRH